MGFSEGVIEFDCLAGGGDGPGISVVVGHGGVLAQQIVGIGEAGVGLGICGVVNDCLGEEIESAAEALRRALVPLVAALEVQVAGKLFFIFRDRGG